MIERPSSTSTQPSSRRISAPRLALDVLHHDEVLPAALIPARVEDLHHIGVDQSCRGLGLALETRDEGGIVGQVLGQQLDRDLALQAQIKGQVDGRHAAEAQPALQPVAPGYLLAAHLPPP